MNRQERRRLGIKGKEPTYNLTRSQLENIKKEAAADILSLLFVLPCSILIDDENPPEIVEAFAERIGEMYAEWQDDNVSIDELMNKMYDYTGVKFERGK